MVISTILDAINHGKQKIASHSADTLQKRECYFNLAKVISVAAE